MAATLGPTAPIAYLLCAVAMGLIVLCMAEAGQPRLDDGRTVCLCRGRIRPLRRIPRRLPALDAADLRRWRRSRPCWSRASARWCRRWRHAGAAAAVLVAIYAFFATVNILGVARGAGVNTALTVAKLLPLLLLIAGGLFAIDSANLAIDDPPDIGTLARSSILLIFAFAGIEAALVPGGEVKDPARTVPLAILIGHGHHHRALRRPAVRGAGRSGTGARQLEGRAAGGGRGRGARRLGEDLLLIGAVVSMLGHAGAMILAAPRTLFAFARDGFLPSASPVSIPSIERRLSRSFCSARSCWSSRSRAHSNGWRFSPTSPSWCSTGRAASPRGSSAAATCAAAACPSRFRRPTW